jgi:hypothetical protein
VDSFKLGNLEQHSEQHCGCLNQWVAPSSGLSETPRNLISAFKFRLVHRHLDFYVLLRLLRNPLALHWTLLPLVG